MEGTSTTFDIRKLVPCDETEDEFVQAGYTIINRMAALLGHINFRELYTTPFADLIPRLAQNIDAAPERFRNPERVKRHQATLAEVVGTHSFLTLYQGRHASVLLEAEQEVLALLHRDTHAPVPPEVQQALYALLHLDGIRWPILTGDARHDRDVLHGIEELVTRAGHLTYRDIYELAYDAPEVTPDVIAGVRAGFASRTLFVQCNNLCLGSDLHCHSYVNGYCSASNNGQKASLTTVTVPCATCPN